MSLAWIGYALLVGTLVAGMAAALGASLRLAGQPTRWVWGLALGLTAALVLSAPGRSGTRAAGTFPGAALTTVGGAETLRHPATAWERLVLALGEARASAEAAVARPLAMVARVAGGRLAAGVAVAWAASSLALAALLLAVYARFARARRRWPVVALHETRVRVAPRAGPAVIGVAHPEIVVPRWLLERTDAEQRLVIAHEREHVAARDPLLLAFGCAVVALMPWHPAVWWMLSRLRLAVELDCDARVLRQGVAPRSYGNLLIDLAGQCSGLRVGALALADESSHLEQRLLAMNPQRSRFTGLRASVLGAAALVALVAACEAKLPTATEVANMNVAGAEQGARKINLMGAGDSTVQYTVDGRSVSAAEARAISPERIASIEMRKLKGASGPGSTVAITTRQPGDTARKHDVRVRVQGDSTLAEPGPQTKVRKFDGIVVVDGKLSSESAMNTLRPEDIVSVEVVKGPAAIKLYDVPEAANGVIKITTKKSAAAKQ